VKPKPGTLAVPGAPVTPVTPGAPDVPAPPRRDAATVLTWYGMALLLVPASLIVHPLGASGTPATMLGVLMLVWWALSRIVPEIGADTGLQPVRIALVFFALTILISYVTVMVQFRQPAEVTGADRGLINLMGWSGVALVAADGLRTRERLETLLQRIVLLTAIIAVVGVIQFAFGIDIPSKITIPGLTPNEELVSLGERSAFRRVGSTAAHPIEFGVVLATILPIAMHFAFGRGRGERDRKTKQRAWICLGLVFIAAPLSVSRSATLGIGVVALVLFCGWPRRWRIQALLWLPFILVGLRVVIPGLLGTLLSLFQSFGQDPSISGRTDDYTTVARFFGESPLIGRGFTTFLPQLYITLDNQYLLTLVEVGLLGLAALLGLFLTGWCCARGARRLSDDPAVQDLGQALAASMACLAITFVTFDALSFPMVTGLFFFLFGCCGALWRMARAEATDGRARIPGQRPAPARGPGR
jgi:hypothetical protein